MVIFNERKWVQEIIETKNWKAMGHPKKMIKYLIKYYCPEFKNKTNTEFISHIFSAMDSFGYSVCMYEEWMYAGYIKATCRKAMKGEFNTYLRDMDNISITQAEMDIIAKAANNQQKKLLFTMYVLAKLYPYHSGWVNYKDSEIFKLANLHLTLEERDYLINDLYSAGLLQLNHIVGKSGFKVELQEDSPVALTISTASNFGNQYLAYIKGDEWIICKECGRLIKKHNNRHECCKRWATRKNREKTINRMQVQRKLNV